MNNDDRERLVRVETKLDMVLEALKSRASKSSITWLKWAISGIGGVAISALIIACQ